jgi:hypothetical protein
MQEPEMMEVIRVAAGEAAQRIKKLEGAQPHPGIYGEFYKDTQLVMGYLGLVAGDDQLDALVGILEVLEEMMNTDLKNIYGVLYRLEREAGALVSAVDRVG